MPPPVPVTARSTRPSLLKSSVVAPQEFCSSNSAPLPMERSSNLSRQIFEETVGTISEPGCSRHEEIAEPVVIKVGGDASGGNIASLGKCWNFLEHKSLVGTIPIQIREA